MFVSSVLFNCAAGTMLINTSNLILVITNIAFAHFLCCNRLVLEIVYIEISPTQSAPYDCQYTYCPDRHLNHKAGYCKKYHSDYYYRHYLQPRKTQCSLPTSGKPLTFNITPSITALSWSAIFMANAFSINVLSFTTSSTIPLK